jgi:hypothetical protein
MNTNDDIEILDEQVVYQQGSFRKVKRWLRGVHPHLGVITNGLTGLETFQELSVVRPMHTVSVLAQSELDRRTAVSPEPPVLHAPPLPGPPPQSQPQSEYRNEAA